MRGWNAATIVCVLALSIGAESRASGQVIGGRVSKPPAPPGVVGILLERNDDIRDQQADMEREIAALDVSIRAVEMSIEEALSRKHLTDRLAAQRTKLRNITPDDIVPIHAAADR